MLLYLLTTLSIILTSSAFARATQETVYGGLIEGTIKFPNGEPATDMMVMLFQVNSPNQERTKTDDKGHYSFQGLVAGDYAVYPFGIEEEYPLRVDMFLSKTPDRAAISEERLQVKLNLTMPPKAGVISATIKNKEAQIISGAQVVLCHADEVWRSAEIHADPSGSFSYVVPSNEEISIYVRNGSFAPYQKTGITLAPGEKRAMTFVIADNAKESPHIEGEVCKPFRPGNP